MKIVSLREDGAMKTAEIIKAVLEQPSAARPGQPGGLGVSEILARSRVLKALRQSAKDGKLPLEDADHKTLIEAIDGFRFGLASEDLAAILTDIKDAPAPAAE